jgi:predicted AlkP superfamily pyrophosphatase or phosphodiesterase
MAQPTAVILIVGLTREVIGDHTPHLQDFASAGDVRTLTPVLPAVTCSVQSSMLTGLPIAAPSGPGGGHGIVGNGWYDRELAEVHFWKQSNRLVRGEKVWETARRLDPSITTANLFWWFNMYSSVDFALTPRPIYKADGRKIPDCHSRPAHLRDWVQSELGAFPLFKFWGPASGIESSRWIAHAARLVIQKHAPTLSLIYLPHLDYAHQQHGPGTRAARAAETEIDTVFGELLAFLRSRGVRPMLVSEYGIEPVSRAVPINRILREAGFLSIRREQDAEALDPGASAAFAVADHQIAHVYVSDAAHVDAVAALLAGTPGIEQCLMGPGRAAAGLDAPRAGDIVAIAAPGHWFSYPWWLDDARAPDYARTVDIHRKPGYDPLELFLDPAIRFPKLAIASRLIKRRLGLRTLLDVIPLDASLVKGSHGRTVAAPERRPILVTDRGLLSADAALPCTAIHAAILSHLFDFKIV